MLECKFRLSVKKWSGMIQANKVTQTHVYNYRASHMKHFYRFLHFFVIWYYFKCLFAESIPKGRRREGAYI